LNVPTKTQPRLLYIFGPGHSGSTLLSTLLNQHPDIFNAGEIGYLWKFQQMPTFHNLCSCGSDDIYGCSFWKLVDDKLRGHGWSLHETGIERDRTSTREPLLFRTIADTAKVSVVVDASKNYKRLQNLIADRFDVLPIL
jgi:hypothetical protein